MAILQQENLVSLANLMHFRVEEELLHEFFGDKYRIYCEKVPIRIPFIKGYQLPEAEKKRS